MSFPSKENGGGSVEKKHAKIPLPVYEKGSLPL